MDDAKCPKCRGPIETRMDGGDHWIGPVSAGAWCRSCGDTWVCDDDFEHLAHWEPRPRLPTVEEEAAHRERHGDGAGWMGRQRFTTVGDGCVTGWSGWRPVSCTLDAHPTPLREWQSYPHVDGRPVGWPEVSRG